MSQNPKIIRARERIYNKPVNIQSAFKESPDVLSLFQGEAFNNNPLMKEMAQLQIMYQFVCDENINLKRKLGYLSESLRGIKDREELVLQLMKYHDEILKLTKEITVLKTRNSELMGKYGDQELEEQKKVVKNIIKESRG